MKIRDINFGDVDAKNELLKQKRSRSSEFFEAFSIPEQVDLGAIFSGVKYFICGLKGTGKTSLLRYIDKTVCDRGALSQIILFKTDVTEDDRQTLSDVSGYNIVASDQGGIFMQDFKEAWKYFIFQRVAELLRRNQINDPILEKLNELTGLKEEGLLNSLGTLFSKIQQGSVSISTEALSVAVELGVNVDKEKSRSRLAELNRACSHLLNKLHLDKPLYLFFDELEVFHESDDQFDRDRRILRDLVYAISHINAESSENSRNIFLCSTLRSEILVSVLELGHEISRDIDDYGITLEWAAGRARINHPLMKLMGKKIALSTGLEEAKIWEVLFPKLINGDPFYKFVLASSYYRPRDIVRLLRVASGFRSSDSKFTQEHFEVTSSEYSRQTWIEITEELLAIYSAVEIDGLQRFFLGFKTHFYQKDILDRLNRKYSGDKIIPTLFGRHSIPKVLSDLYRIGVIGNDFWSEENRHRVRWIFRGNNILNDSERMTVHRSLWKHLSLVRPS